MGYILNPTKENSFERLFNSRNKSIFVDKTDFIDKLSDKINAEKRFFAVTRPRRFGKTVTAHMLLAYYSKGYDGQRIFDNLKISQKAGYAEHLNKYHVIYIDMNTIDGLFDGYSKQKQKTEGVNDLVDYFEYAIISELKSTPDFSECLEKHQIENTGLLKTLQKISQDLDTRFIFIMDEWDLVYREYRNDEALQRKFIKLLRNLFKSDGGKACFNLVYLTGILPIKKYNSQSALNDFDEYNMLAPGNYAPFFGFTENDVADIVKSSNCKVTHQELKEWYEGYKIKGIDIYNPNSVCQAVNRNECISYWSGTSSNIEFISLINMNFQGIKDDILHLIEGGTIQFSCETFQNDMVSIENKDDVFSLLVCLGYLGCVDDGGDYHLAYVPNKEIKTALSSLVKTQPWFNSMPVIKRSEALFTAITTLDGNKTGEIITEIHNSPNVSLLSYNREESMVFCLISGLMWRTEREYECFRELQSGKGSADLIYVPKRNINLPIMLIEFKYGQSAAEALNQIKEKEYFSRYQSGDYPNDILLIGINYNPKTKEHQCLIEKMD